MNDFQIYNKKFSKLSLQKNNNPKLKTKNMPQGLKSILITNSNGLEISSQYANFYRNSKKNMMEDNYNVKHITYNNSNNNTKNLSFPINTTSSNKNINIKYKDNSLMNQKNNLFKKFLNNSKKEESLNYYNSRESTCNNIDGIVLNKASNLKINIIPKKYNFKFINVKENNISFNSNINNGKSMSKSKSKSKNKKESKSYNNKINNNINKMIIDKYLKLYKIGEKGLGKKVKAKKANNLHKESPFYNITKNSNDTNSSDIHKMSSLNMITNIQFKGLKKKNKSSNLLINNYNKSKNMHISKTNSNIIITKIESNGNLNFKNMKNYNNKSDNINNKSDNNKYDNNNNNNKSDNSNNNNNNVKNNKKYLTENHIMYLMNNKNSANKKQKVKNNKEKQIYLNKNERDTYASTNTNTNTNTNLNLNIKINNNNNINSNNNSKNNYLKAFLFEKANNESNNENIIYDYKSNNILTKKNQDNNNLIINFNKNNKKSNINNENNNNNSLNLNMYKIMNERLKTEYNDIENDNNNNSLEIIDKMYEEENTEEINQKSSSYSHHDSFRFLYPEIYNRDDENIAENNKKINYNNNNNNNYSNDKKEKELDETESPLKMDTDKVTMENSGVLSFDQVKDIICYYNMNTPDKQNNFLFKQNERQIFDINIKNKYANFFLANNKINNNNYDNDTKNNNNNINSNLITNDLIDDIISFKNNINLKYPSGSIFSLDTEYSSKMKKKYNKNLVKNI